MPDLEVKTIPSLLSGYPAWDRLVEREKRRREQLTPLERNLEDKLMRRVDDAIIQGTRRCLS